MIGLVSQSLKTLLETEMTSGADVTLLSPAETSGQTTRVNLFLYRVAVNPFLGNREWQPKPGTTTAVVPPPLVLDLFYLLTPYAALDPELGQVDAHDLLAEAVRVLYQFPIVPEDKLATGLGAGEIKVTLHTEDVEEIGKLWTALNQPYRLSAIYEVSFAQIPVPVEVSVPRRVERTEVEVVAADRRPVVARMAPRQGPAGTTVQFSGHGLAGWEPTVTIGGVSAPVETPLEHDDRFTVDVPAALAPGIYEVDVGVPGMTRLRDIFEVTP
jgi:hypothetical protein